ncbi:MAG: ATP-binding protein [Candidatus Omnitrophica bacterium]|nr:ATP-binding protein [Candidatus Omnitrophota bacterium]
MKAVCDYMTKNIVAVSSGTTLIEAIQFMRDKKIGSLLIKDGEKTKGIFTERDFLNKVDFSKGIPLADVLIDDVMTKNIKTVPRDESYTKVIALMKEHGIRHMPVEDNGEIIGIVSLRDLLLCSQEHLRFMLKKREEELKEHMHEIKESELRFRTIFNNSAVGITLADEKERIIAWNPFLEKMLKMKDDELYGKRVESLYPPEEWKAMRSQNIRELGIKHHLETKVINGKGDLVEVDISITVLKDPQGKITGSIGIMRDITERKRIDQFREEFAGVVSHELRTPLIPIKEGVKWVLDGSLGKITEQQREFLTIALQEIERLTRIINNLLDVFKLEAGKIQIKREFIDLVSVCEGVVSTFQHKAKSKNIELKTVYSRKSIKTYADKDRITQAIANLVGNSVKFTKKGSVTLTVNDRKENIEFNIEDTGSGIAKKDMSKLFQKFQQFEKMSGPDESGTGLGLAISKDIIGLHKGKIKVKSEVGKGTIFTFTLPKYSVRRLVEENVTENLREGIEQGTPFSVITYDVKRLASLKHNIGKAKFEEIITVFEKLIEDNLRRMGDTSVKDTSNIFVILPGTVKDNALAVGERVHKKCEDYLYKERLDRDLEILWRVTSFPDDGKMVESLLKSIWTV